MTINADLNQVLVTYVKQQLRFTDKMVECLAIELGMELGVNIKVDRELD